MQKCLTDSDDEVRERAYFFINLLTTKGDETFLKDDIIFDFAQAPKPNGEPSFEDLVEEKAEISNFVFDSDAIIDVDALEAFV